MESIVITWRELLIAVALILAVYIAEMLLLMRSGGSLLRRPRWLGIIQEKKAETYLRHELEALRDRLEKLEDQVAEMRAGTEAEASPYARAIQMARQGRDVAQVSASCGISRGEAELIVSMHGGRDG